VWATSDDPHLESLPEDWEDNITYFEKLIILKGFRPEKLLIAFT